MSNKWFFVHSRKLSQALWMWITSLCRCGWRSCSPTWIFCETHSNHHMVYLRETLKDGKLKCSINRSQQILWHVSCGSFRFLLCSPPSFNLETIQFSYVSCFCSPPGKKNRPPQWQARRKKMAGVWAFVSTFRSHEANLSFIGTGRATCMVSLGFQLLGFVWVLGGMEVGSSESWDVRDISDFFQWRFFEVWQRWNRKATLKQHLFEALCFVCCPSLPNTSWGSVVYLCFWGPNTSSRLVFGSLGLFFWTWDSTKRIEHLVMIFPFWIDVNFLGRIRENPGESRIPERGARLFQIAGSEWTPRIPFWERIQISSLKFFT